MSHGRHRLFDAKRRDEHITYMNTDGEFVTRFKGFITVNGFRLHPVFTWKVIGR